LSVDVQSVRFYKFNGSSRKIYALAQCHVKIMTPWLAQVVYWI